MLLENLPGLAQKAIVLASASPRRSELLQLIGLKPEVIPSNFEENVSLSKVKGHKCNFLQDMAGNVSNLTQDPCVACSFPRISIRLLLNMAMATAKGKALDVTQLLASQSKPADLIIGADTVWPGTSGCPTFANFAQAASFRPVLLQAYRL